QRRSRASYPHAPKRQRRCTAETTSPLGRRSTLERSRAVSFVHVELPVQSMHELHVNDDQQHEADDRALLRKPKAELEARDFDSIQPIYQQNGRPVGDQKPDRQESQYDLQVLPPVALRALGAFVVVTGHALLSF